MHHMPASDRRETTEARVTQHAAIPVVARQDREDEGSAEMSQRGYFLCHRTVFVNARKMF